MLMNVSANMLVATAPRGSIPNWNIAGTVINEVLPVTTLMLLVAKKMSINAASRKPITILRIYPTRTARLKWPRFASAAFCHHSPFALRQSDRLFN
jgi:hypothetical protein